MKMETLLDEENVRLNAEIEKTKLRLHQLNHMAALMDLLKSYREKDYLLDVVYTFGVFCCRGDYQRFGRYPSKAVAEKIDSYIHSHKETVRKWLEDLMSDKLPDEPEETIDIDWNYVTKEEVEEMISKAFEDAAKKQNVALEQAEPVEDDVEFDESNEEPSSDDVDDFREVVSEIVTGGNS